MSEVSKDEFENLTESISILINLFAKYKKKVDKITKFLEAKYGSEFRDF